MALARPMSGGARRLLSCYCRRRWPRKQRILKRPAVLPSSAGVAVAGDENLTARSVRPGEIDVGLAACLRQIHRRSTLQPPLGFQELSLRTFSSTVPAAARAIMVTGRVWPSRQTVPSPGCHVRGSNSCRTARACVRRPGSARHHPPRTRAASRVPLGRR